MAQYDPAAIIVTFIVGGVPLIITGFAEGSMVAIAFDSEGDDAVAGSAGEVARVRNRDPRATVTIRLLATAVANKALSAIYEAGNAPGALSITDTDNLINATSTAAFLRRPADIDMGAEVPVREWSFRCPNLSLLG